MFAKEVYIARRKQLAHDVGEGLILLLGNEESPMNYRDNTYRFRQDSSFLYFTGLDQPGLSIIIDAESGKTVLFGTPMSMDDVVWMGQQPTLEARAFMAGIVTVCHFSGLFDFIAEHKRKGRRVHYLPPYRALNEVRLHQWLGIPLGEISAQAGETLLRAVVKQRNIKSTLEIEEIERAVNITVSMHEEAMRIIRPGLTEAEVAAQVRKVALAAGGDISFPIIATVNGQTLHNHFHGNILEEGDMFLLDAGAETAMHYAGDMSSTIPVNGQFSMLQREIYDVALSAHETALSALRPGVAFRDIHLLACKTIAQGMKDLGFMKGDLDDAVAHGAHALFFPCGLGHMMGLDVHDMEDLGEVYVGYDGQPKSTQFGLKSLRLAKKLEPGNVLTIEPGVYFIPDLIDQWRGNKLYHEYINFDRVDRYREFGGIRNEEDVLITDNGYRVLGRPLAKSPADVEHYMQGK